MLGLAPRIPELEAAFQELGLYPKTPPPAEKAGTKAPTPDEKKVSANRRGRRSTIMTGPTRGENETPASTTKKTLLGG